MRIFRLKRISFEVWECTRRRATRPGFWTDINLGLHLNKSVKCERVCFYQNITSDYMRWISETVDLTLLCVNLNDFRMFSYLFRFFLRFWLMNRLCCTNKSLFWSFVFHSSKHSIRSVQFHTRRILTCSTMHSWWPERQCPWQTRSSPHNEQSLIMIYIPLISQCSHRTKHRFWLLFIVRKRTLHCNAVTLVVVEKCACAHLILCTNSSNRNCICICLLFASSSFYNVFLLVEPLALCFTFIFQL